MAMSVPPLVGAKLGIGAQIADEKDDVGHVQSPECRRRDRPVDSPGKARRSGGAHREAKPKGNPGPRPARAARRATRAAGPRVAGPPLPKQEGLEDVDGAGFVQEGAGNRPIYRSLLSPDQPSDLCMADTRQHAGRRDKGSLVKRRRGIKHGQV